jgi:hypothetical protein
MALGSIARIATGAGLLLMAVLAACPQVQAGDLFGCFGCCCEKCQPKYQHCSEGPPRIKFHMGCAKPVCDPCHLEHWGYYQNCWHPYPWLPDWSHCTVPPSSALVPPCAAGGGPVPTSELETAPPPRMLPTGQTSSRNHP